MDRSNLAWLISKDGTCCSGACVCAPLIPKRMATPSTPPYYAGVAVDAYNKTHMRVQSSYWWCANVTGIWHELDVRGNCLAGLDAFPYMKARSLPPNNDCERQRRKRMDLLAHGRERGLQLVKSRTWDQRALHVPALTIEKTGVSFTDTQTRATMQDQFRYPIRRPSKSTPKTNTSQTSTIMYGNTKQVWMYICPTCICHIPAVLRSFDIPY